MNVEFAKVIDGATRYINAEIIPGMNQVQEFAARLMLARIIRNQEAIKEGLIKNAFIRTFGAIDDEGMVDISELALCERIYADARDFMRECGNGDQWGVSYPPKEQQRR